jgi:hypothetical protein
MRKPQVRVLESIAKTSPTVEPPPQETEFFSRLKSLFTRQQNEPAEVVEHSIMSVNP